MNLREGTRRLALLLGAAGAIIGGVFAYAQLQSTMRQRADHKQFEQLANSDAVQQDRKDFLAGWVSIDSKTGERIQWGQQVDKGGIKTIHWTKDNEIESIETEDGYWSSLNPQALAPIVCIGDDGCMDVNTRAFRTVQQSIGELPIKKKQPATAQRGLKRAAALTKEQRVAIAKKAAAKRWPKTPPDSESPLE